LRASARKSRHYRLQVSLPWFRVPASIPRVCGVSTLTISSGAFETIISFIQ
jgi:hypothetical protein